MALLADAAIKLYCAWQSRGDVHTDWPGEAADLAVKEAAALVDRIFEEVPKPSGEGE